MEKEQLLTALYHYMIKTCMIIFSYIVPTYFLYN